MNKFAHLVIVIIGVLHCLEQCCERHQIAIGLVRPPGSLALLERRVLWVDPNELSENDSGRSHGWLARYIGQLVGKTPEAIRMSNGHV